MSNSSIVSRDSKLDSLRLLFSTNFDDNDLLSILEEAQDDLDLAIARISEGQTETWELYKKKTLKSVKHSQKRTQRDYREFKEYKEKVLNSRDQRNLKDRVQSVKQLKVQDLNVQDLHVQDLKDQRENTEPQRAGLVKVPQKSNFQKKKKFDKVQKVQKDAGKTSWAQLVKGEEELIENSTPKVTLNSTVVNTTAQTNTNSTNSNKNQSVKSEVINSNTSTGVTINLNVGPSVLLKKTESKKITTNSTAKKSLVVTLSKQPKEVNKENSNLPPGLLSSSSPINAKKSASKQQEAVIMPSSSHLSSMGVQFGSLNKEEKNLAQKVAILDSKRIPTPLKTDSGVSQNTNAPSGMNMMHSYPSMTPVSYFQQMPGFGMMPQVNSAEFQQMYGTDNLQGYYSNHYAKFPAGSQNPQSTSASGTSQSPAVSSQNAQQMAVHQQQYAMPFGYYPYYMPGQFQNSPGAHPSYGGQYVNKNMYHYGPSASGAISGTASLTSAALPASNTQSSSRSSAAPVTAAGYPYVSAPPLYGAYDESLGISGTGNVQNIPFQSLNSGFSSQSIPQSQATTTNRRVSTSGSSTSGPNFSNQRPVYDKFSSSVGAQSTNDSYYPNQPSYGNQYQHQQHQHQQYYVQQQPQQVVYGNNAAYGNVRTNQQNQQYWTSSANGGQ